MLIVYKKYCINLQNVNDFFCGIKEIYFYLNSSSTFRQFNFKDENTTKQAFERIIDYYRWQRSICDLNDLSEE